MIYDALRESMKSQIDDIIDNNKEVVKDEERLIGKLIILSKKIEDGDSSAGIELIVITKMAELSDK